MKRNHPYTNDEHQSSDDEYDIHPDNILFRKQQDILAAKFSISLETEHKLSQRGTDDVISSTKLLFDETLFEYKKNLSKTMHNHGIPTDVLDEVPLPDVFPHLSTQNHRNAFYTSHMHLIQPKEVLLWREYTMKTGMKTHVGYFIPFENNLNSFLSLPEIWREITNCHRSDNDYMHDICDGSFIRNQHLFQDHPRALQIVLYTDDIEIVNPIGSHTSKHK